MVKAALITINAGVLHMLAAEVSGCNFEVVWKESVQPSMIEKTAMEAMEYGVDIIIAYCPKPIRSVYKGVSVPVIYIGYQRLELYAAAAAACREKGFAISETVLISRGMYLADMPCYIDARSSVPAVISSDESGGIDSAVEKAARNGTKLILGDVETCGFASSAGIASAVVYPDVGAIRIAAKRASREAERIVLLKRHQMELSAVMNSTFCGIIEVNRRGTIIAINDLAARLLDCWEKTVNGMYVLNVFQELDKELLDASLSTGNQVYNHVLKAKRKSYIVNIEPVIEDGEVLLAVISIQKTAQAAAAPQENPAVPYIAAQQFRFSNFVYSSELFRNVIKKAKFASYTDVPILLMGEEGTETLELAQAIHRESGRCGKPYIETECNAWNQQRIDELLFGGTVKSEDKQDGNCLARMAEGGTLFLNHVDELSSEVQFKIYKLITGYYICGSGMSIMPANVRIIAATNKNLRELITCGEFREDLFYALSVISITIPPLRDRKEDIPRMVDAYSSYFGDTYSKPVYYSKQIYDCISEYRWPGNSRQLKHYCQKLVLTTPSRNISETFARSELENLVKQSSSTVMSAETEYVNNDAALIIAALEHNRWNKTKAAEELGISKTTLWRKIQKYGITEVYH